MSIVPLVVGVVVVESAVQQHAAAAAATILAAECIHEQVFFGNDCFLDEFPAGVIFPDSLLVDSNDLVSCPFNEYCVGNKKSY